MILPNTWQFFHENILLKTTQKNDHISLYLKYQMASSRQYCFYRHYNPLRNQLIIWWKESENFIKVLIWKQKKRKEKINEKNELSEQS